MKKTLSILLSVLLAFALAFTLTGCGDKKKGSIVGTWETEVDMTEGLYSVMSAEDEDFAQYFDFEDFTLTMIFKFNDDDTYEITVDEDKLNDALEALRDPIEDGYTAYFENELGMSIDEIIEASDYDSLDDLLDEALEQMKDTMDTESVAQKGEYEIKDGKIYMDSDEGEEWYEYELSGDKMKFTASSEEDDMGLLPMTLKKK